MINHYKRQGFPLPRVKSLGVRQCKIITASVKISLRLRQHACTVVYYLPKHFVSDSD